MTDGEIADRVEALERKVSDLYRALNRHEPGGTPQAAGFARSAPASPDEDPWIVELVTAGRTIEAVRAYQQSSGSSLAEAKQAIDRLEALHRPAG